jgi:hypothetical protein
MGGLEVLDLKVGVAARVMSSVPWPKMRWAEQVAAFADVVHGHGVPLGVAQGVPLRLLHASRLGKTRSNSCFAIQR